MTAPIRMSAFGRDLRRRDADGPSFDQLSARLDSMIATQMQAYPSDWTEADRRELAERHLFNAAEREDGE